MNNAGRGGDAKTRLLDLADGAPKPLQAALKKVAGE